MPSLVVIVGIRNLPFIELHEPLRLRPEYSLSRVQAGCILRRARSTIFRIHVRTSQIHIASERRAPRVRFGSEADIGSVLNHVRLGPIAEVTFRIKISQDRKTPIITRPLLAEGADQVPSPASNREYLFLHLCHGEVFGSFQVNVREVGQFIGWNHAVDYRWTFRLKRLCDGLV